MPKLREAGLHGVRFGVRPSGSIDEASIIIDPHKKGPNYVEGGVGTGDQAERIADSDGVDARIVGGDAAEQEYVIGGSGEGLIFEKPLVSERIACGEEANLGSRANYRCLALRLGENFGLCCGGRACFFNSAAEHVQPATVLAALWRGVRPVPAEKNDFAGAKADECHGAFTRILIKAQGSFRQGRRQQSGAIGVEGQPVRVVGKGGSLGRGGASQQCE